MKAVQTIPAVNKIRPLEGYRLYLEFNDGVTGIVDLSHLKGKGVFEWWDKDDNFFKVFLHQSGAIAWNDDLDIDALNCYLTIANKSFEEYAGG